MQEAYRVTYARQIQVREDLKKKLDGSYNKAQRFVGKLAQAAFGEVAVNPRADEYAKRKAKQTDQAEARFVVDPIPSLCAAPSFSHHGLYLDTSKQ